MCWPCQPRSQTSIKLIYLGDTGPADYKNVLTTMPTKSRLQEWWHNGLQKCQLFRRQKKTRLLSIYSLLVNMTVPIWTQSYFRSKISILSQVVPNVQKAIKLIYCPWGGDVDNLGTTIFSLKMFLKFILLKKRDANFELKYNYYFS